MTKLFNISIYLCMILSLLFCGLASSSVVPVAGFFLLLSILSGLWAAGALARATLSRDPA